MGSFYRQVGRGMKKILRNGSIRWGFQTGVMPRTGERIIRAHRDNVPAYINPGGATAFILDGKHQRTITTDGTVPWGME